MRIRKRKVPYTISSLSPIPISDPLFAGPPVQLHLEDDADDYYDPRPADQPASAPGGRDSAANEAEGATSKGENKEDEVLSEEAGEGHDRGDRVGEKTIINNDSTGKGNPSNVGALVEKMILQQPAVSSSREEKVVEEYKSDVKTIGGSEKMKRKVSGRKNTERHDGYAKEENDQSSGDGIRCTDRELDAASGKKGRGRSGGAVIMEGSRCSRVNGRGWRCCQQTLVGYSLCEHHLGKGRLRSMNNVAQKKNKAVRQTPLSNYRQEDPKESSRSADENGGLGEKVPAVASMSRRRTKLGVVKARSMSSLLGQHNEVSDHDQL